MAKDNFKIRKLKIDIIMTLNESRLPVEVRRLVLGEVMKETDELAEEMILKEAEEFEKEQKAKEQEEKNGIQ